MGAGWKGRGGLSILEGLTGIVDKNMASYGQGPGGRSGQCTPRKGTSLLANVNFWSRLGVGVQSRQM